MYQTYVNLHQIVNLPANYSNPAEIPSPNRNKRKIPSETEGPFPCDSCDKVFVKKDTLNHHKNRKHFKFGAFKCSKPKCNKSFSTQQELDNHMKSGLMHPEKSIYACTFEGCEAKFNTLRSLNTHAVVKHGELKFICKSCNAMFGFKYQIGPKYHTCGKQKRESNFKKQKCEDVPTVGKTDESVIAEFEDLLSELLLPADVTEEQEEVLPTKDFNFENFLNLDNVM